MHRKLAALAAPAVLALAACSPTFNWREVRAEPSDLSALLPCKPDHGTRTVPFAGRELPMQMTGCDAGGATFAIAFVDLGSPAGAGEVLAQWKTATLAHMGAAASRDAPFVPPGALGLPQSVQASADGHRADGSAVQSRAAYFARGTRVYQAVIYAQRLTPEAAETFFGGLRFP